MSNTDTEARGATYDSGKPCKRGHGTMRLSKGGACPQCVSERGKTKRAIAAHARLLDPPPRKKRAPYKRTRTRTEAEQEARRLAKNERRKIARRNDPGYRERARGYQRKFDAANREQENARKLAYYHANPHTRRAQKQRRRASEYQAEGRHTEAHLAAILAAQGGKCAYCGASADLHLDHVIPLARGGTNWPWNLQWLCAFHNVSKGARTDAEYRSLIGLPPTLPISWYLWSVIFSA